MGSNASIVEILSGAATIVTPFVIGRDCARSPKNAPGPPQVVDTGARKAWHAALDPGQEQGDGNGLTAREGIIPLSDAFRLAIGISIGSVSLA